MTEIPPSELRRFPLVTRGAQPIAVAAAALVLIVSGIGAILLWRIATGMNPEQERAASARLVQARVAQASEQIMEKTKGLELNQQESIDQLQALQDQLRDIQKLVSAQRGETKRLSEQVGEIGANLDSLRQSFASARSTDTAERPAVRSKPTARAHRSKARKPRAASGKRAKPHR